MRFRFLYILVAFLFLFNGCNKPSPVIPDDPTEETEDEPEKPAPGPDSDIDATIPEGDIEVLDCTVKTSSGKSKCSVDIAGRKIYARHIADLKDIVDIEFTFGAPGVRVPEKVEKFCAEGWPSACKLQFVASGKGSIYDIIFCDCVASDDPDIAPSDKWKIAWSEEFVAPELDVTVWERVMTAGQDNGSWNAFMGDADDLVEIRKGRLVLWARENPSPTSGTPLQYATGGIRSEHKFYRTIGRIDVKARMDKDVNGYWPAIWLMPGGPLGQAVERLKGGEIDILEYYRGYAYQTVHSLYNGDGNANIEPCQAKTAIDPSVYHVYSVEVTDRKLSFLIDGTKKFTLNKRTDLSADKYQFPYHDVPHGVILSAQLGSSACVFSNNFIPVDGVGLPAAMEIDFVRFYDEVK